MGTGDELQIIVIVLTPIVGAILGVGWLIFRIAYAVATYGLRASVVSLLENIILYRFRIAAALIAISLAVQLSLVLSAPAANCQSLDAQTAVSNILMAKGSDVINKKYSKLFAALKEQKDGSENAKQSEREIFGRYTDELNRYHTEMTTLYPFILDDIRTVSRKAYLNAVTCAAKVKINIPSISAHKEFEYDVHETIFGALRSTVNF
jgi:hypothetical protein